MLLLICLLERRRHPPYHVQAVLEAAPTPYVRAIVASLMASAKLNGVEPLAWLTEVLERMVSGRTKATELERLLPWNWSAERLVNI